MKLVRSLLLFTLILLSFSVKATVVLTDNEEGNPLSIAEYFSYLEDVDGLLSYSDVLQKKSEFAPLGLAAANFGFTKSSYWFHTIIENTALETQNWLLEIGYPFLDNIAIYQKTQGGELVTHRAGDHQPFKDRAIDNRNFVFPLFLAANNPTELFIRIETSSSMQLPMKIYSYDSYVLTSYTEYFFLGLYYGALTAIFIYNLMLIYWIRDPVYVYYAGYLLFYGIFQLNINGLAYNYLWPESTWLAERGLLLFLCLAVIFAAKFSHSILQIGKISPTLEKLYILVIAFFSIMIPFCLFADYQTTLQILSSAAVATCVLFLFSAQYSVRRGISTAKYYLMSLSVFIVGIFLYIFKILGLVESLNVYEYTIMVGSTFEAILLSFALSHRFKMLKDENTRMQAEAHGLLERSVTERTKELESVLEELSVANRRLEGLNNTDKLTGVRSRAYFDVHAEFVWKNANRSNEEIAIMMLDVDNFKFVNDNYGHLIGDEVLISVAQAINSSLTRSTDQMARYGGEEFIVILSAAEFGGIVSIAEKMRLAVEGIDTLSIGLSQSVTISIGVTLEQPSAKNSLLRDAIERADKALYQAKHNGKNCVVVYEFDDESTKNCLTHSG